MIILRKLGYITYLPHEQWNIHCWVSTIITPNICAVDPQGSLTSCPPR